jgi:hypothetical protein
MKKWLSLVALLLLVPLTAQAQKRDSRNTVYVQIDTSRGTESIPLVRKGDGFVGPRGEYYPKFPSKKTLGAVYGGTAPKPTPARTNGKLGEVKVVPVEGGVKILSNGKTYNVIRTKYPDIRGWKFARDKTAVVVKSGVGREPGFVEMFDLKSGQRLEKIKATDVKDGKPAWAKDFAE